MKANNSPAILYLAAVGVSLILSIGEGYFGIGSMLTLLLTLPWSVSMIVFSWALIHDGARSLLIFLIPFAAVNAYIIHRLANRQRKNGQTGGGGAA